jgi:adenosylcobinamide-phosphate synthase
MLVASANPVAEALRRDDLAAARIAVGNLVSREVTALDGGLVAAAVISSLAENLTDSVIAPWLCYLLGGLPLLAAYRTVNTLDSMIGYRGHYEWLGKACARIDDALNYAPARLSAVAIMAAAPIVGVSGRRAALTAFKHHQRTPSPNGGWTMAAMAGALGVRLEKRGYYVLGEGRQPAATDIARSQRIVVVAAALTLAATMATTLPARMRPQWRGAGR